MALLPERVAEWLRIDAELAAARDADAQRHRANLETGNSSAYFDSRQRSEFYRFAYEEGLRQGHQMRWSLGASYVAHLVSGGTSMWGVTEGVAARLGLLSNDAQTFLRRANQVIFDDVFPKLAAVLAHGGVIPRLTGLEAIAWDARTLIEEQTLIQSLYNGLSNRTFAQIVAAAQQGCLVRVGHLRPFKENANEVTAGPGRRPGVPSAFVGDILDPFARWRYGMALAAEISTVVPRDAAGRPAPIPDAPPDPRVEYLDGSALARVDVRPNLHRLEALADSLLSDEEAALIDDTLRLLTPREQQIFLSDARMVQRLAAAGARFSSVAAGMAGFQVDLERQLELLDAYTDRAWQWVGYAELRPQILAAPLEQRQRIRGARWQAVFVLVCDNQTIRQAVADLGLTEGEAREWVAAEDRTSIPSVSPPPPPALNQWTRLISFRPPVAVQQEMRKRRFSVHRLEVGAGPIALDFYPVLVTAPPPGMQARDLLENIRRDINIVIDTNMCQFKPYESRDRARWLSRSPVGSVIHIDMFSDILGPRLNLEDGSVVCSEVSDSHWVYSTVWTLGDGGHPVSGNREFGVLTHPDGSFTFYTRGADRLTCELDSGVEWANGAIFTAAHQLWTSFQTHLVEWVIERHGAARAGDFVSQRFEWSKVQAMYHRPDTPWV